jgi:putative addiction module component (TIGR02574 family)
MRGNTMADTSIPVPEGFSEMSKSEQVRYLQALWDQIAASPGELPVPESHLELAEARLNRYREDPSRGRSVFEVLDRLSKR